MQFVVAIVGDDGCGKSALMERLNTGTFINHTKIATQNKQITKEMESNYGHIELKIREINDGDQACKQLFFEINLAIIMFDLTSMESYLSANYWKNLIKKYNKPAKLILCGNKFDMKEIEVRMIDVHKQWCANYYAISTKSCFNIENVFAEMLRLLTNKDDIDIIN